jgi:hypothetical protein
LQGVVLEGWDNIKLFAVIVQSILLPVPPTRRGVILIERTQPDD